MEYCIDPEGTERPVLRGDSDRMSEMNVVD